MAVHLYRESSPSLQCRNLAFDQNKDSTSRGCTPQVAENDSKRLMERYGSQQKYSAANWPGEVGAVSPETSVEMAWARAGDEWWQNSNTIVIAVVATLGTWRQKKARSATCHLATCCRQWLREGRTVLGRSNVFDGRQKRMEKLDRPVCLSRGGLRSKVRRVNLRTVFCVRCNKQTCLR